MAQAHITILSGQALFAEAIARRLRQYLESVEIDIVDPRQPDAIAQIAAIQASAVVVDITDVEVALFCPLSKLLLSLPQLKVICLDPQQEQVQVVTSEQRTAVNVRDLAEVINQSV